MTAASGKATLRWLLGIGLLLAGNRAAQAQNIYPDKFDGCHLRRFCLDCGEPQARYAADLTAYFRDKLPAATVRKATGGALVQVLVDSLGQPCALSQTSNLPPRLVQQLDLRGSVNGMGRWLPAQEKNQPTASSVSLRFSFGASGLRVDYQRFDARKLTNLRSVGKVEVLNQQRYPRPSGVAIEPFTTANSRLPWDMSRAVCIDQQGTVWAGTDNGVVEIRHGAMQVLNAANSGLLAGADQRVGVSHAVVDSHGYKWFSVGYRAYRYDGQAWTRFDSTNSPVRGVGCLVPDAAGNVWVADGRRLLKYDGSRWQDATSQSTQQLPASANRLFVDRQNRVWVSTRKGCLRLENGQLVPLAADSPLAHAPFNCAAQDSDGTLWFGLADYSQEQRGAGLVRLSPQGEWRTLTASNSGYPGHNAHSLLLDAQHQLWLGIDRVGLARFDGQQSWMLFTPENSAVPSTIVYDLALAADGTLWGATFAGLFALRPR